MSPYQEMSLLVQGFKATDGPTSPTYTQAFSLTTALSNPTFNWADIVKITIQASNIVPGAYPVRPLGCIPPQGTGSQHASALMTAIRTLAAGPLLALLV